MQGAAKLKMLRTPEMLVESVQANAELARDLSAERPLLRLASSGVSRDLSEALTAEENVERESDRLYWQPLKAELERLRHAARQK